MLANIDVIAPDPDKIILKIGTALWGVENNPNFALDEQTREIVDTDTGAKTRLLPSASTVEEFKAMYSKAIIDKIREVLPADWPYAKVFAVMQTVTPSRASW